jgi:pimeloyl-ACP methyl ester carboxylesterase
MIRRFALAVALLGLAACERQPTAPTSHPSQPSFTIDGSDDGPPSPPEFTDTKETGVATGEGVVTPGLKCAGSSAALTCSGYLRSDVDGTMIDVTLMIPNGSGPFPLVALLHGWAGSKNGSSDIASTLVSDGNAVLRYSARGFGASWGLVNLSDVDVEIGDLRSVISQVVDHPGYRLNPGKVAVTGTSYGGGQSWLALVQPEFVTPQGATVKIAAVVPIVPWSDLLYSLLPNGHGRFSVDPPGALKFSYVNALYASGCRDLLCSNYPAYLKTWHAWLNTFEPTNADPVYRQIRDGLAGFRSIWWQRAFWKNVENGMRVPVFVVEGFTDDLFTLEEAKRMLLALERVAPDYPISAYFGDVGHPRARNKPAEVEYALGLMRSWLNAHLRDDVADPAPTIYAAVTGRAKEPFTGHVITVSRYSELANRWLSYTFPQEVPAGLTNPVSGSVSGPLSDPLLEAGAGTIPAAGELKPYPGLPPLPNVPDPTAATYEVEVAALDNKQPVLIAGQLAVTVQIFTTAPRLQLNVRVYDVDPGTNTKELITRGTYTEDRGGAPLGDVEITIPTAGNLWSATLERRLQVQITNNDAPYIFPSRVPSATTISSVRITIPVR